ncbi:MAG: T9SS type A sorting domain-containing protein, partial [Ignavibacteria bacterium]|nr:T9SS type A sorting domain-containing protein [Ignavibacteria bacterium]
RFWASEPYPQPARVKVRARIAWDGSFDLSEAVEGVYDSMGRKVEGRERIQIQAEGKAEAQIEWNCEGVPSGIYFILLRWNAGSETVPVVIE